MRAKLQLDEQQLRRHAEPHRLKRVGWLRAAVLGANDGIISTSSLVIGVASAHVAHSNVILTGVAGLVAGAMSMATGEYISVSSQADIEKAALAQEKIELESDFDHEHRELAAIYVGRGLDLPLAKQVAQALMSHDALGAHVRDELGISDTNAARPLQAAGASALSCSIGAALPLTVTAMTSTAWLIACNVVYGLIFLALLGAIAAKIGGAKIGPGMLRVVFWSTLSMGISSAVGILFRSAG